MRTPRQRSEQDIYHVISRGTGRQLIFEDDDDRRVFLQMLQSSLAASSVELYAWCLMGNHVHLLMHAPLSHISDCLKRLCGSYAQYFNRKSGRTGHLFQERFKSEPINDEGYLLTVIRYIHDNPSKAGVSSMQEYRWSSYQEYVHDPILCNTQLVLGIVGGVIPFITFHNNESGDTPCLDVSSGRNETRPMPDEIAREIADSVLGDGRLEGLKEAPINERRESLRLLKKSGLTVRQIERLTGIGRNTVQRA